MLFRTLFKLKTFSPLNNRGLLEPELYHVAFLGFDTPEVGLPLVSAFQGVVRLLDYVSPEDSDGGVGVRVVGRHRPKSAILLEK